MTDIQKYEGHPTTSDGRSATEIHSFEKVSKAYETKNEQRRTILVPRLE